MLQYILYYRHNLKQLAGMQYLIKLFSTHRCKLDYRGITFIQKISNFVQWRRFFDISALSVYFNSNHLAVIVMAETTF